MPNENNFPYVKFFRGSIEAWNKLNEEHPERINNDTLYFIYDTEGEDVREGSLYLGRKLISGKATQEDKAITVASLDDIHITEEELTSRSILAYNEETGKWENWNLLDIIPSFSAPATSEGLGAGGLVPTPTYEDRTKFLRGDGTWVSIPNSQLNFAIKTLAEIQTMIANNDPAVSSTIFLVASENATSDNLYKEYVVIEGRIEPVGDFIPASLDLSNYIKKDELQQAFAQTKVGDLSQLQLSDGNKTLVEEINTINRRLQWTNLE